MRLTTQTDIDNYAATILADGQRPMDINDEIIFEADQDVNGNIFHDGPLSGVRNGCTIWIEAGTYGMINIGEGIHTTSATSINVTTLTDGGSVVMTVGAGLTLLAAGQIVKVRDDTDSFRYFFATITSYSGTTLTLGNISQRTGSNLATADWDVMVNTAPSDASNPVRVHPLGGRVIISHTTNSRQLEFWNFDHLIWDFETNSFPGLRDGWGSGRKGTFGLHVEEDIKSQSGMALKIDNTMGTMKQLEIRGCEMDKGNFAKIRAVLSENHLTKVIIERNLGARGVGGEFLYIGQTSKLETEGWASLKNFIVRNNIALFPAAEGYQLQEPGDGSKFHNNIMLNSGSDYKAAFQASQDTGFQIDMAQGGIQMYNNILDGFGTNGIHLFQKDLSTQVNALAFGANSPLIKNNAVCRSKSNRFVRMGNSLNVQAITRIIFRDNDFIGPANMYQDIVQNYSHHVESDQTNEIQFVGGRHANDGRGVFDSVENHLIDFNIVRENVAPPEYVNSGFDNIDLNKMHRWSAHWEVGDFEGTSGANVNIADIVNGGSYVITMTVNATLIAGDIIRVEHDDVALPFYYYATVVSLVGSTLSVDTITDRTGPATGTYTSTFNVLKLMDYAVGDFVWPAEDGEDLPFELYKCISAHQSGKETASPSPTRPDLDAVHWEIVWWDVNGKNQYDPLYNDTPLTNDFMEVAGDMRLVKGSVHHLLNRGLECNEQRDDCTMIGWQWKQTISGTIRDIPGAYKNKLTLADYSYLYTGRYYRSWIDRMDSGGTLQARIFSPWTIIS